MDISFARLTLSGAAIISFASIPTHYAASAQPAAPVIIQQPADITVGEYRPAGFSVVGFGDPQVTYQWRFNDVDLVGETNSTLTLAQAELTDQGSYSVVISNALGSVLSLPAALTVIPTSKRPGDLDFSFAPPILFTDCGFCLDGRLQRGLLVQPNDQVLVGGTGLRRLHADGQWDTNFNSIALDSGSLSLVTDMALQGDGRILICGTFTEVHNTGRNGIARLNSDGRLDESFDPGSHIAGGSVLSLAWQTNGQVLIAGTFTNVENASRNGIARLNANGSLDPTFAPGTGATPAAVNSMMLQSDGAVLLAGDFTSMNGVSRLRFARLRPDGSVDGDFVSGATASPGNGPDGPPRLLAVQPDGKIWIGGGFGSSINLVRLRPDGSVDLAKVRPRQNPGILSSPLSLVVQPNGKVLVGGRAVPLARLHPDGDVDPTFVVTPFRSPANTIRGPQFVALQSDGRIVVAGDFIQVGNTPRPGLARLYGGEVPFFPPAFASGSLRFVPGRGTEVRVSGYPGLLILEAASRLDPPDWVPVVTTSIGANPTVILDTNALHFSQRFYRLVSP
jgi:uncharacterized delta-60 repeat protein